MIYDQELEDLYEVKLNDKFVEEFDREAKGKPTLIKKKNLPNNKIAIY